MKLNARAVRCFLTLAWLGVAWVALCSGLGKAQAANTGGLVWKREADSVALCKGDQEVWRFRYGKDDAKPAFHPLALPAVPRNACARRKLVL